MATIRFARLSFEKKLNHYSDSREALERRRENLKEVIDYYTNINTLLENTDYDYYTERGEWGFGDVGYSEKHIWGQIGKRKEETDTVRDDRIEGFRSEEGEDNDVAFFIIDIEESIIAYEYRRNVGKKAPVRIIEGVYNSYHPSEHVSSSLLVNKHEVMKEIENLEEIEHLKFVNLHPTNPDSTNHSQDMDEFLRNGGISNMTIEADGEEKEGIRLQETPLLNSSLGLAEEGYGRATIEGVDRDGDEKEIRTDGSPIVSEIEEGLSEKNKKRQLLEEIDAAVDRINDHVE